MKNQPQIEPEIGLRQLSASRTGVEGYWNMEWQVENKGANVMTILSARLPHGQFKSDESRFEPPIHLASGHQGQFQVSVRCAEPPGEVTENAFVILCVTWSDASWRMFARVHVVIAPDGNPEAAVESITTQRVGFSGVTS